MRDDIIKKWQAKQAVVAIIGLGYVGLPLALSFAESGVAVIGIDKDESKLALLKQGQSYLNHISDDKIGAALSHLQFSSDSAMAAQADGVVLCLPTPLKATCEPDLSYIHAAMQSLLPHLKKSQVLALESTTYPGTTEEEIAPLVQAQGFNLGEDFFLVYSPEREDPGNSEFSTADIPKVLGGYSENCRDVGLSMYRCAIAEMVAVKDMRTAEMVKLLENIYRAVNIGLVNEMKQVSDRMGIDIYEVIQAADSKPFGFKAFYPGPGVGGHCIPVDPFYLTWKARAYGLHTRFIELAGEINKSMPEYVIGVLAEALNRRQKSVKGSRVLLLGVSYKKNIGDLREAPALDILARLQGAGAEVSYSDPFVESLPQFDLQHTAPTESLLQKTDAVIIVSDHDAFDYESLARHADLIIDSRGRFAADGVKIIRA